ncbi:MAG TPA: fused MFS/spermidine synthase [Enteractinococcus sp.]
MSQLSDRARIMPSSFDDGWVLEIDGDIQSHVDLHDPGLIRFEYLRRIGNVIDFCWPPADPLRCLHLGAGALTLARYVQVRRPGSHQTVIELDPDLIDFVTSELPLPTGTHLEVIIGDARATLQDLKDQTFDVVIVDIFTGHDTLPHLSEPGFYQDALARLSACGVLLVNIGDDEGLEFFKHQAQLLHHTAHAAQCGGAWTLADASTLERNSAGNAVLATGPGLPTDLRELEVLRSRLASAGPYPAAVLSPSETLSMTKISPDDE